MAEWNVSRFLSGPPVRGGGSQPWEARGGGRWGLTSRAGSGLDALSYSVAYDVLPSAA